MIVDTFLYLITFSCHFSGTRETDNFFFFFLQTIKLFSLADHTSIHLIDIYGIGYIYTVAHILPLLYDSGVVITEDNV